MAASQAEEAYTKIRDDILSCTLEPGQQLTQSQLAEQYGYGLTPIRDALHRLARDSFVHPMPRFGYTVTPVAISDIEEIYQLRTILEPAAVRWAIQRASDEELAVLVEKADFTYVYKDKRSYGSFSLSHADFMRGIAAVTGNRRLFDEVSALHAEFSRILGVLIDVKDSVQQRHEERLELVRALCARNEGRAVEITLQHLEDARERISAAIAGGRLTGSFQIRALGK